MTKDDSRKCPGCQECTATVMHRDEVKCSDCGKTLKIEYIACICGFSWREVDGKYMDGCQISVENVEELLDEVGEFFEEQGVFAGENPGESMGDLIHKCLKCGAIATQSKPNTYECTACNFYWEVDKFNE